MKKFVSIKHGYDASSMAYDAISKVFDDNAMGKRVLLKPNAGRKGEANTGLCTNSEVVRGVVRFFKDRGAKEIFVGDGALWGVDVWEAMEVAGISEVCRQEGVVSVNLDEYSPVYKNIGGGTMVDRLRFSSLVFDVDMVVSIPVIKTHMYTGATLSIKNMKGCLHKMEKTRLHRIDKPSPDLSKGRCLDYGISDMATVLLPDYAVSDGTYCMEGFGPSVGTPISLDLVLASKDATAADLIAITLMGMEPDAISHVNLVAERCGDMTLDDIEVDPLDYMKYSKSFAPADLSRFANIYPNISVIEKGSCSACSATIMTFVQRHATSFDEDCPFILAAGKDLSTEDLTKENIVLVGNCAGIAGGDKPFCKGCPPVGSSILSFIEDHHGHLKFKPQ